MGFQLAKDDEVEKVEKAGKVEKVGQVEQGIWKLKV